MYYVHPSCIYYLLNDWYTCISLCHVIFIVIDIIHTDILCKFFTVDQNGRIYVYFNSFTAWYALHTASLHSGKPASHGNLCLQWAGVLLPTQRSHATVWVHVRQQHAGRILRAVSAILQPETVYTFCCMRRYENLSVEPLTVVLLHIAGILHVLPLKLYQQLAYSSLL